MFVGGRVISQQLEATVDGEEVFLTFYSLSTPTNQSPQLSYSGYMLHACAALLSFFFFL